MQTTTPTALNTTTRHKAIVYGRVSTSHQAEEGTSLATQLKTCLAKAATLEMQVVDTFEDAGISGQFYATRPGLQAALSAIEGKLADTLIVASLCRLSRDAEHQQAIRKRVKAAGGQIVFCDAVYADTPEGDLYYGINGHFKQYERAAIKSRTVRGRRAKAEAGVQPSRSVSPYGYHIPTNADVLRGQYPATELGTYQVVEERAVFIREAFQKFVEGESLRAICKNLMSVGAPTSQGGREWHASVLRLIIENPIYKGVAVYGRKQTFTDERRKSEGGFKHAIYSRLRNSDEWLTIPAPALVSEDLWNMAQARLRSNQQRLSGNPRRRCLLSGMALCSVCGRKLVGHSSGKSGDKRYYYQCPTAKCLSLSEERVCSAGVIVQADLDALVIEAFLQIAARPAQVAAAVEAWHHRVRPSAPTEADRAFIETELAALEKRERATIQAQIAGISAGASPELYAVEFAEIARLRKVLVDRKKELTPTKNSDRIEPQKAADIICHLLQSLSEVLTAPEITAAERQGLLSRVVESVIADTDFGKNGLKEAIICIVPPYASAGETVQRIEMRRRR